VLEGTGTGLGIARPLNRHYEGETSHSGPGRCAAMGERRRRRFPPFPDRIQVLRLSQATEPGTLKASISVDFGPETASPGCRRASRSCRASRARSSTRVDGSPPSGPLVLT
jgi:hypothetical protein